MFLDYLALFLLFFVAIVLFYGVIVIHDIPYEIAVERNHPHQDAIHVAGWVSLFTLHVLWPFLWIWATLWRQERGWGFVQIQHEQQELQHRVQQLDDEVTSLRQQLAAQSGSREAFSQAPSDEVTIEAPKTMPQSEGGTS